LKERCIILLNMVEAEVRPQFTRSLYEVAKKDFFATIIALRQRYVFGFKPQDFVTLTTTMSWLEKPENLAKFEKANKHPEEVQFLPDFARSSLMTANLCNELREEVVNHPDNPLYKVPVAFETGAQEFTRDLYVATYGLFEKLKNYVSEKKDEKLEMIANFYSSGGKHFRKEATDAVSVILFKRYWENLKESAKKIASGKPLAKPLT